jgi:hypothetical protein
VVTAAELLVGHMLSADQLEPHKWLAGQLQGFAELTVDHKQGRSASVVGHRLKLVAAEHSLHIHIL